VTPQGSFLQRLQDLTPHASFLERLRTPRIAEWRVGGGAVGSFGGSQVYVGSYAADASDVHHAYGSTSPISTRERMRREYMSLPRPRQPLARDVLGIGGTDLASSAAFWRGSVAAGARHLVSSFSPTVVLTTFSPATSPPLPPTKSDGGGDVRGSEEGETASEQRVSESELDSHDSARESECESDSESEGSLLIEAVMC